MGWDRFEATCDYCMHKTFNVGIYSSRSLRQRYFLVGYVKQWDLPSSVSMLARLRNGRLSNFLSWTLGTRAKRNEKEDVAVILKLISFAIAEFHRMLSDFIQSYLVSSLLLGFAFFFLIWILDKINDKTPVRYSYQNNKMWNVMENGKDISIVRCLETRHRPFFR